MRARSRLVLSLAGISPLTLLQMISVKPEPQETKIAPLSRSSSWQNASDATRVKPEPMDGVGSNATRSARDLRDRCSFQIGAIPSQRVAP